MKKSAVKTAFLDTVPVMTGYLFLGFGFGIVLHQIGYGVLWSGAMSLFIYAGSMQYMAVSLLTSGAGLLTTALTTFVVNARHLFYGISMVDAYKGAGKKKPLLTKPIPWCPKTRSPKASAAMATASWFPCLTISTGSPALCWVP